MQVTKVRLTRERGRLVLQSLKHTVTGQSYVSSYTVLDSLSTKDKDFKSELPQAVTRLFFEAAVDV